jgi:hypothetical protein
MNEIILGKIQGYLDALALVNSSFNYNIGYNFTFYEVDYYDDVSKSIKEHIYIEYKNFLKYNSRREDNRLLSAFENNFNLVYVHNWVEELNNNLPHWFFQNSFANYQSYEKVQLSQNVYGNLKMLSKNFIDLLNEFFTEEHFEIWKLNEFFSNELIYFWGGLCYLDYIFSTKDKVYILHFDFVD